MRKKHVFLILDLSMVDAATAPPRGHDLRHRLAALAVDHAQLTLDLRTSHSPTLSSLFLT